MATGNTDKIKQLLGSGLSNEVVATAVGVHPSYISQLMSEDSFKDEVVALRTTALVDTSARDRSWDGIEGKLLARLDEMVESRMIYKTQDVLKALQVANSAKRRGTTPQDNLVVNKTVVVLNMPVAIMKNYTKNSHGEVIEVEGQTLVTMQASELVSSLAKETGKREYAQVGKFLPSGEGD